MRKPWFWFGWLLMAAGCFQPSDADFRSGTGLEDDEFLWVIQLDRSTPGLEGIFDRLIPLIRPCFEPGLPIYEGYGNSQELSRPDLGLKMDEMGVTGANDPGVYQVLQVFCRGRQGEKNGGQGDYLQVMFAPNNENQPPQLLFGVYLDVLRREFPQSFPDPFLQQPYQFPGEVVYLRTNRLEYIPRTQRESQLLKRTIAEGNFAELKWIEGELNVSGKSPIDLEPAEVLPLAGSYGLDDPLFSQLYLTAERGTLVADWAHRFAVEKLYPFREKTFFSLSGEIYRFEKPDSGGMQLEFIRLGDTVRGARLTGSADPF